MADEEIKTKKNTHSEDKVLWIFKNAHEAKLNAWNIWILLFLLITLRMLSLSLYNIYLTEEEIDFKKIKFFIMTFDLMCLGIVAIKEHGKFPVRYLVLLPIIHYVFELIFFPTTQTEIYINFINLIISIIIYNSIKVFNDLLFFLNEYVNYRRKKWEISINNNTKLIE